MVMSDRAYIRHILNIYSAYIGSRRKAGGKEGNEAELTLLKGDVLRLGIESQINGRNSPAFNAGKMDEEKAD